MTLRLDPLVEDPVVVVGIGNRFPDAAGPDALADLVQRGHVAARPIPPGHPAAAVHDPRPRTRGRTAVRAAALLDDVEDFDRSLFAVPRRLARAMSPAVRLLLETTWEALEDAGVPPRSIAGTATGVFVASYAADWLTLHTWSGDLRGIGTDTGPESLHSMASGRIAHAFDTCGPALTVDSACSSSLVALHLAARSLRDGECEMALVGAATLALAPEPWVSLSSSGVVSDDGRSRTFDAGADGYGRGEGVGVLVVERLSRARAAGRRVLAVVRGSAVRHDGRTTGILSPNGDSQVATVRAALADAGVTPGEVGYVEAHGTGTPVGDVTEMASLVRVFGDDAADGAPLRVGSVKANIGHLEAASGLAGLVNAVLALGSRHLPPNAALRTVNPRIVLTGTRLRLPTVPEPWPPGRRLAGVNAFGMSGTNAHVVLEAGDETSGTGDGTGPSGTTGDGVMLPVTARTADGVARLAGRYADGLDGGLALADLAATAVRGRSPLDHRAVVVAADAARAADDLRGLAAGQPVAGVVHASGPRPTGAVCFLFPGRDRVPPGTATRLRQAEPVVARTLAECAAAVDDLLPVPLLEALDRDGAGVAGDDPASGAVALFAVQHALARLWASLGRRPDAVLGDGVGMAAAAVTAGALDAATAVRALARHGPTTGADPAVLDLTDLREPAVPLVSAATGRRVGAGHGAHPRGGPDRLDDAVAALGELDPVALVEVGTGSTLSPRVAAAGSAVTLVATLAGGGDAALQPHRAAAQLYAGADVLDVAAYAASRGGRLVRAPRYPFERERVVNAAVEASRAAIAAAPDGYRAAAGP